MDINVVTRRLLELGQIDHQNFGTSDCQRVEHMVDLHKGNRTDLRDADMSPAQLRMKRTVTHHFLGEITKEWLAGILRKPNGVRIEVYFDATPAALMIEAHI